MNAEEAVGIYVLRETGHYDPENGHEPVPSSYWASVSAVGVCDTCGPETDIDLSARCACGAYKQLFKEGYQFAEILQELFEMRR